MKKILSIVLALCAFAAVASAQPRALGVRLGGAGVSGFGYGAEISYQQGTGAASFLEADLGWSSVGINGSAIWDVVFASVDNFNFYVGPGVNAGLYGNNEGAAFSLGVLGQLGAEYQFGTIPFNISLDWRPTFFVLPSTTFSPFGVALSLRYRF